MAKMQGSKYDRLQANTHSNLNTKTNLFSEVAFSRLLHFS